MKPAASAPSHPSLPASRLALFVLVCGALVCVLAAVPSALFDLDRHSVPKELALHATVWLAGALLAATTTEIRFSRLDAVLGLWLFAGAASAVGAENPWLAARSFAVALSGVGVFWISRTLAVRGASRTVLLCAALAAAVGAATALAQAYGLDLPVFAETRAPGGTFGNRNFMAHLLALGLPSLVLCGLRAESAVGRRGAYLGTALVGAALVLSRTRAAWLSVALSTAAALPLALSIRDLWSSPDLRRRGLRLAAAGIAGGLLAVTLPNTLDWRSSNPYLETAKGVVNYKQGSGKGRLIQYRNTLGMLLDHPVLGVGPGNWPVAYPRYASRGDPSLGASSLMPTNPWPSSDWLGFLVEWGPAGLGLLALALGALWWRGLRGALGQGATGERLAAVTLASTVTALVVVGAVDSVLHLATPSFLFWAAAGALAPTARPWKTLRPGPALRAVLVAAVLAVGGALTLRSATQGAAILIAGRGGKTADLETAALLDPGNYRLHMLLAEGWARRGRCDRARTHAAAALRLFPHLTAARRLAATCGKPAPSDSPEP